MMPGHVPGCLCYMCMAVKQELQRRAAFANAQPLPGIPPGDPPAPKVGMDRDELVEAMTTALKMDDSPTERRVAGNLVRSLISETRPADPAKADQEIQLLRWQSPTQDARQWRITLAPVRRVDNKVPTGGLGVVPGQPMGAIINLNVGAAFTARPNPVLMTPHYVRVRWGVGPQYLNELVADWPQLGSSIDVVADNVQVDAIIIGATPVVPTPTDDGTPVFGAALGPGFDSGEAPGLSFAQLINVANLAGTGSFNTAVPNFARTVSVRYSASASPQTTQSQQMTYQWLADANTVLFQNTLNSVQGYQLVVPGRATSLAMNNLDASTEQISLQWRIAP